MKQTKKFAAALCAAVMSLGALGLPASAGEGGKSIAEMLKGMTLEQKIEQMIMITVRTWSENNDGNYKNVASLTEEHMEFIKNHNFAGVCLFAPNVQNVDQTIALTTEIQQAALDSECGIPMLISADQEGGNIYRLGTGTPTCGNMALGASRDPELAYENAKVIGSEISSLGINTDLAPVVDVNNNPANPVINIRSFGSDPELVSTMAAGYIKGLQSEGVVTACKHFPGHGDTGTDSHTGLPLVDKSLEELKKLELYPYTAAIEAGTDMIMTAHIQFPQIEKDTYTSVSDGEKVTIPATLSDDVITGVLRNELKYDGVVITDSMIMAAIKNNFSLVDSAVLAINADVDIILEPFAVQSSADMAKMEQYIKDVAEQVREGNISEEEIDDSVMRILKMKQNRGILDYTAPDAGNAHKTVGSAEHRETALKAAEKAVTLIKNDEDVLPLDMGENGKAAFFYPYDNVKPTMDFALDRLKKEGTVAEGVTYEGFCLQDHTAEDFEENVKNSDVVIIAFEMYRAANIDSTNTRGWQAVFADDMIKLAHKHGKKVIFISANIPYDAARFTDADAILAAYNADGMPQLPVDGEENPAYGVNYPAALITVFGGNSPTGKLPVDVYALDENTQYTDEILFPFGYGLNYKAEEPDDSQPDSGPDSESESEPDSAPDSEPESESESEPDSSSESESDSEPDSTSDSEPEKEKAPPKEDSSDKSDNPKTGTAAGAAVIAAAAVLGTILVKKRS
ncbi:beta-N-acetylhexosaminidase [Ruminococcaceae bacterium FB2012]|nr:beta-N-acetylhexosaminidase [Ruminococcaceae bacterium FB2012]